MDMEKSYEPQLFEKKLYEKWMTEGYFTAKIDEQKKPFTIVMPPPNITGQLHLGHALDNSVQDCLIRYKRMQGYCALLLPGTDHASIATEVKIIDQLKKEGLDKKTIGREAFLDRAWEWKRKYGGKIVEQQKRLGASCDWSREAFTMDKRCSNAVNEVFVNLYDKGLIFQGSRIINWCPECKTAISEAEVEYTEQDSHFWYFKYMLSDNSSSVTFATTRPETMLGDMAIAVNPNDTRYKSLVGKSVIVPFDNRLIPIISDDYVEKDFGTGVVKITPAHDPNDFEVGIRHNLPVLRIMNDDGTINELGGSEYQGLNRFEARKKIVKYMQSIGQLVKIEDYKHNVGECYRCHTTIEPIISKQWFVKMESLAKPAIDAVKNEDINFVPKRFEKTYFNWMENIKDWCISRQLWWGHRIPAYYCDECSKVMISKVAPTCCDSCGSKKIHQDEDVLDTWFSSALWPFSTLGFPEKTADLDYFFPTDVLVTAYDIIFFWVARMIFSSLEHMKEVPFKDVLIHGIVRDSQGRKMSKSLGNGIDPLEIIDKFGADTLRFSLLNGVSKGGDMRFSNDKLDGAHNFMNKLWNASRFVVMNSEFKQIPKIKDCNLSLADKWILSRLNKCIRETTNNLNKYELGMASNILYEFVWNEFCDWYIEFSKPVLYGSDEPARLTTLAVLNKCLEDILKLLHPFIPFITEEIYQNLGKGKTIMLETYPKFDKKFAFNKEEKLIDMVKEVVIKIRNTRAETNTAMSKRIRILIKSDKFLAELKNAKVYLEKLCNAEIEFVEETPLKVLSIICECGEIFIPLLDIIDVSTENERIKKEIVVTQNEIIRAEAKLTNQGFLAKAPAGLVETEQQKLAIQKEKLVKLNERLTFINEI